MPISGVYDGRAWPVLLYTYGFNMCEMMCIIWYNFMHCSTVFIQAALGDGSENRERGKDFTFDYSYWSHKEEDRHFAPQVLMLEMEITIML